MYSSQFDPVPFTEAVELAVIPKESYNINVIKVDFPALLLASETSLWVVVEAELVFF